MGNERSGWEPDRGAKCGKKKKKKQKKKKKKKTQKKNNRERNINIKKPQIAINP